jgi:hypothetical protein
MPTEIGPHNLTSNTSNPPFVASANGHPTEAWEAFNGNPATFYQSDPGGGSYHPEYPGAWLQLDTGSGGLLNSYAITCGPDPTTAPLSFTLQGSPDGVSLTVLDTRTAEAGWTAGQTRTYTLPAPVSYRYFVLFITAVNGATGDSSIIIGELYFYGALLTAQAITFPALTDPAATDADAPLPLLATASSGLPITYAVTGPATLSGSGLTITGVGTVTVIASQQGNSTYAVAPPVTQAFVVATYTVTAPWPAPAPSAKTIASGILSITSSYSVGSYAAFGAFTLGAVGLFAFGENIVYSNAPWPRQTQTFPLDVPTLAALQAGSLHLQFWINGTLAGTSAPPCELNIYGVSIAVTYSDGTQGVMRARLATTVLGTTPTTDVLNPGNAIDGVWDAHSTVLRSQFSSLGTAWIYQLGTFAIAPLPMPPPYNLLVFDEGPEPERQAFVQPHAGRWFYHRNAIVESIGGFFGFFFDGISMVGLTGEVGGAAAGLSLADFRSFQTSDPTGLAIESVYQSHYEDAGEPDNDKMWLEIAIDAQLAAGSTANVYVGFNNGTVAPLLIGSLAVGPRKTTSFPFQVVLFPLAGDGGYLARNISVIIDVNGTGLSILHNIYLYYYVEARLAATASTIPTDLGVGKNKQCKEVQFDIDATLGPVTAVVVSDLPGNALAIRATLNVAESGRAVLNFPFPVTEGLLWQVVVTTTSGIYFRLYGVRLLMRVLGVYVQAYESSEGFLWDSMQVDLGDPDVKFIDQLQIEMDTDPGAGTVSATILTDLPGEAFVSRGTSPYLLVTQAAAATPRAWVTVPLPDQGIWGRSIDVRTTGTVGYRIYTVRAHWRKIGRYLCGSTPSGFNDAMNVLEFDFKSERINVFKRLEIDCWAFGVLTVQFLTDQNGGAAPSVVYTTTLTTAGRQAIVIPLPPGLRGRLLRVRLTSPLAAFLFAIRVWTRAVDVLANDSRAIWSWQPFPLEESDALPQWTNLLIDETSPLWKWVDMDFTVKDA